MDGQLSRVWLDMAIGSLEVATAGRACPGELASGDASVALARAGGALLAVVDGLGHGVEASAAAEAALAAVREAPDTDLTRVVAACEAALRHTRGCVLAAAAVHAAEAELSWVGIGNVEAATWPARGRPRYLRSRPGIVGFRMEAARTETVAFGDGDVLVIATDGLDASALDVDPRRDAVARTAARILGEHARAADDCLVLVARRLLSPVASASVAPAS
jgi:negative regulator of sigma-B (phosphoserine phosphatase)